MGNMPAFAIDLLLAIFHYNVKMQGNDAASAAEVALKYGIKSIQSLPNGESDQRLLDFLQKVACWIQMSRDNINDTNKYVFYPSSRNFARILDVKIRAKDFSRRYSFRKMFFSLEYKEWVQMISLYSFELSAPS